MKDTHATPSPQGEADNKPDGEQSDELGEAPNSGSDSTSRVTTGELPRHPLKAVRDRIRRDDEPPPVEDVGWREGDEVVQYRLVLAEQWKTRPHHVVQALKTPGLLSKSASFADLYRHHRIGRAVNRYLLNLGKVTAGGISYMAIFSLVAAVTVGWSLFSHFFAANPTFQSSVIEAVDQFIPGLITDPYTGNEGVIDPDSLRVGTGTLITGIAAFLVAFWSASRIVRYSADGVRSMFGLLPFPGNFFTFYARYFVGLVLLFLGVVMSALLSLASDWFEKWLTSTMSLEHPIGEFLSFDLATVLVPATVDLLVFYLFIRYVAAVKVPRRTLWAGALIFAVASESLRLAGTAVIHISSNPLLAAATTLATLMVWVNILARVALLVSAWMSDPPAVAGPVLPHQIHSHDRPNYVTLARPGTLAWPHHPVTGALIPAEAVRKRPSPRMAQPTTAQVESGSSAQEDSRPGAPTASPSTSAEEGDGRNSGL